MDFKEKKYPIILTWTRVYKIIFFYQKIVSFGSNPNSALPKSKEIEMVSLFVVMTLASAHWYKNKQWLCFCYPQELEQNTSRKEIKL